MIEVLVATLIAGICLFPIARFVYKARWNQEARHVFQSQGSLDSLMRAMIEQKRAQGDSVVVQDPAGYKAEVVVQKGSYQGLLIRGRVIGPENRILRQLWAEVYP